VEQEGFVAVDEELVEHEVGFGNVRRDAVHTRRDLVDTSFHVITFGISPHSWNRAVSPAGVTGPWRTRSPMPNATVDATTINEWHQGLLCLRPSDA